jgi:hypothetical protein
VTQNATLQKQAVAANEEALGVDSNRVFVCQMSRRQAEQLSNSFGNDSLRGAQVQNVYGLPYNDARDRNAALNSNGPEQTPASAGIQNRARAAGDQERMVRGGLDSNPAPTLPTTAEGSIQQKAEIAPVTQLAGAPNYSLNAPVPAERAMKQGPSTQPAPSTGEAIQQAVARQPALADTTAPADEPVNVVIMVQPNAATAAAAAPSTQPVSEPLRQKAQAAPSQQSPALK